MKLIRPGTLVFCSILFASAALAQITIDGQFDAGEWSAASSWSFTVELPGGATTPGEVYMTNDSVNVYVCVRYQQASLWDGESVAILFDADRDGELDMGDDGLVLNRSNACVATKTFTDIHYFTGGICPPDAVCSEPDIDDGGTAEGNGATDNDGTWTVHELWHPLASGDSAHDITASPGQKLPFMINMRLLDGGGAWQETFYPGPGFTQFKIYYIF